MTDARYVVGIDLGTTNTVVAYADLSDGKRARSRSPAHIFTIEQQVAEGAVAARPLLPSTLYAPLPGEGDGTARFIVGEHARARGVEVPGRVVTSAKSWLAHGGVDRTADILPWGANEPEEGSAAPDAAPRISPRISPIDAQATILAHVRAAWDRAFAEAPLVEQAIVLTVPASFDEVARALTIEATKRAGFPEGSVRLLEEPQAAFLDWVRVAGDAGLREVLGDDAARDVLVCDVGGGTSDFSLIRVARDDAAPAGLSLRRVAVGDHLLLGGDNMDIALAHRLEPRLTREGERLSPARFAQLAAACRVAKEQLLAQAPSSDAAMNAVTVTLLGRGSRLVGGALRAPLTRADLDEVVLDGFFPLVTKEGLAAAKARRARTGLVAFGLPYASDPAITRHLAAFLARSRSSTDGGDSPVTLGLLLNGGVFHAGAIAARIGEAITAFEGVAPRALPHGDPDLAVARGAVAYGLALRGFGRRVGGGSAHGYYVGVASEGGARHAVCVVPRGAEPEERQVAAGKSLALTLGRSARFDLFASPTADDRPGDVVTIDDERFAALAPLVTVVRSSDVAGSEVRVELQGELTEIGTLELFCVETGSKREHRLAFELRREDRPLTAPPPAASLMPPSMSAPAREPSTAPTSLRAYDKRLEEALARIERVFGKPQGDVDPREAKSLVRDLERILGERATWPTAIVRPLFDVLRERGGNRRRSADHERVWWSLIGYLMRPGFGDPLDPQRIAALAPLHGQGLFFPKEATGWRAWWVAWRRVAGGLDEATQLAIRDTLDPFLAPDDGRPRKKPASSGASPGMRHVKPEPWDEVIFLLSSLERVPARRRSELGAWLLERTWTATSAEAALLYAAIGRLGARVPAYASAHHVVSPRTAESWLAHVLRADWSAITTVPFAAVQLARATGDRARDVSDSVRAEVARRLEAAGARAEWVRMVREVVALDEAQKRELFGEALPLGLRLVE